MKKMRMLVLGCIAVASLLVSCGGEGTANDENQEESGEPNTSFSENTPLGQASVEDDVSDPDILDIAIGSKDHTTLVAAVQAAGIEHILVNAGPLTVFAPTNAAFDALPAGTVDDLLKPENKATLAGILTMHAAPGTFNIKQLKKEASKGRKIYTATGDYFVVEVKGEDVYVDGAKVLGEVNCSNGYIVVIDKVLSVDDSKN